MVEHKHKVNDALVGVVAVFAIVLIVYFALSFTPRIDNTTPALTTVPEDSLGYAAQAVISDDLSPISSISLCKIIVGLTTIYDDTTLAVTLEEGASTTYAGNIISVTSINSNGCVITVNGAGDYLATGQIQRIESVYITVKDVIQ